MCVARIRADLGGLLFARGGGVVYCSLHEEDEVLGGVGGGFFKRVPVEVAAVEQLRGVVVALGLVHAVCVVQHRVLHHIRFFFFLKEPRRARGLE